MRARDYKIPFSGTPGKYNAITDVEGVEVGYKTLNFGEPEFNTAATDHFARTGVTAILPRGKKKSAVFAGRYDLNGNGELTGTHWIDDYGFVHGPIMITNTNSVGVVHDAVAKWLVKNKFYYPVYDDGAIIEDAYFFYPVVAETCDATLNNYNGFMVTEQDAIDALESAKTGAIAEGCVGGGTGMVCHEFKGGTGTASRIAKTRCGEYTVGVLVQANHGTRDELKIAGIPFGKEIKGCNKEIYDKALKPGDGSIICIVATDAPLMPWQLSKLCRHISAGISDVGGGNGNGSGDIFLAFSTANEQAYSYEMSEVKMLSDEQLDPLFLAVRQATEEAIVNTLIAADDMRGRNRNFVPALPKDQIEGILKKYNDYLEKRYGVEI